MLQISALQLAELLTGIGRAQAAVVQGLESEMAGVRGSRKTEFKVVGDDYFDNGRIISWRCLLIEQGRVVAENRSFMWR